MPRNGTEYRTLDTNFRNKRRQTKYERHGEQFTAIGRMNIKDAAGMHKIIKEITRYFATACIKSKYYGRP